MMGTGTAGVAGPGRTTVLRLRQIALGTASLEPVVDALGAVLGLEVAHRDPAVGEFGLHNALLPLGDQFLEVLAPLRDGTAVGRHLARHGGDRGYLVLLQTDDHRALRDRLARLGVRTAFELEYPDYSLLQLHPGDTGGSFLEIDVQVGGEPLDGPWMPAGPHWHEHRRTELVQGMVAAELRVADPDAVAARWAAIVGRPVAPGAHGPELVLDLGRLRFTPATDGRPDALAGLDLRTTDPAALLARAEAAGLPVADDSFTVGGLALRPVTGD